MTVNLSDREKYVWSVMEKIAKDIYVLDLNRDAGIFDNYQCRELIQQGLYATALEVWFK